MELIKRVLTALALIPIVLLLVLRAPIPVLVFVAAVVALLAIRELLKLAEAYGIRPLRLPTCIYSGLFFLLMAVSPGADFFRAAMAISTALPSPVALTIMAPYSESPPIPIPFHHCSRWWSSMGLMAPSPLLP